jgi:hypothetical protein
MKNKLRIVKKYLGYPRKRKKKRKKDSSQVFHHRG